MSVHLLLLALKGWLQGRLHRTVLLAAVPDERFALLNRFFKAYISEDVEEEKRAYRQIESLVEDRQSFAASTRKAFEASLIFRPPEAAWDIRKKHKTDSFVLFSVLYIQNRHKMQLFVPVS